MLTMCFFHRKLNDWKRNVKDMLKALLQDTMLFWKRGRVLYWLFLMYCIPGVIRAKGDHSFVQGSVSQGILLQVQQMVPRLQGGMREQDPFGLPNSDAKVVKNLVPQKPAISQFVIALQNLPIDGVNPERREFYVGARNIYEGDQISMNYKGQRFQAKVLHVKAGQVFMQDEFSGEKAVIELDIIPNEEDQALGISSMEAYD